MPFCPFQCMPGFISLTQNTTVYTDGVENIEVKVYIYNRLLKVLLVEMTGEDNEISSGFIITTITK